MSPSEISKNLSNTFEIYLSSLPSYTHEAFDFKKEEDIWSLGQMYEHLYTSGIYFFLANINRCLEKRKGTLDAAPNKSGFFVLKNNEIPEGKYERPDTGRNPEPVSRGIQFYEKNLPQLLTEFLKKEDLVSNDSGEYRTEHPYFGFLNAREWYQSMEIHLRHHLRQKAELESYID